MASAFEMDDYTIVDSEDADLTTDEVFLKRTKQEIATMKGILESHKSAELEEKISKLEAVMKKVETKWKS